MHLNPFGRRHEFAYLVCFAAGLESNLFSPSSPGQASRPRLSLFFLRFPREWFLQEIGRPFDLPPLSSKLHLSLLHHNPSVFMSRQLVFLAALFPPTCYARACSRGGLFSATELIVKLSSLSTLSATYPPLLGEHRPKNSAFRRAD